MTSEARPPVGEDGDANAALRESTDRLQRGLGTGLVVVGAVLVLGVLGAGELFLRIPRVGPTVDAVGRQRMLSVTVVQLLEAFAADRRPDAPELTRLQGTMGSLRRLHDDLLAATPALVDPTLDSPELRDALALQTPAIESLGTVVDTAVRDPLHFRFDSDDRRLARAAADEVVLHSDRINLRITRDRERAGQTAVTLLVVLLVVTLLLLLLSWRWFVQPATDFLAGMFTRLESAATEHARLAHVARRTTNSVALTDRDARITWVNEGFTKVTGYPPEEAIGRKPGELLLRSAAPELEAAMAQGRAFSGVLQKTRRDGSPLWVRSNWEPTYDARGEHTGYIVVDADVTELVEVRRRLDAQVAGTDLALEAAKAGTWVFDLATQTFHLDDRVAALYGVEGGVPYTTADFMRLVHRNDRAAVAEAWQRAIENATDYVHEFRIQRGGVERWLTSSAKVVRDADGRPARVIGVNLDVTDIKRLGDARREVTERLERLARAVPGVLYIYRARPGGEFDFPYASAGWRTYYGVAPEDLYAKPSLAIDLIHEEDKPDVVASIERAVTGATAWEATYRIRHPTAGIRWMSAGSVPDRQGDGTILFYGMITDVTERRAADARAAETARTLAEAQRIARVGNWSWNLRTQSVEFSAVAMELFGLDALDHAPRVGDSSLTIEPEDLKRMGPAVDKCLQDGTPYSVDLHLKDRSRAARVVRVMGRSERDAQGPFRLFGSVLDVTEAVEREELLASARAQAEAANEAKSRFLANMSHEIRTPMSAIVGYADLLAEPEVAPAASREYAATIRRNARHLLQVVNDVLDLSKIEAGRMNVERVKFSPAAVAREVVSLLRPAAEGKNVSLKLSFDGPVPREIESDPTRLRQILMNLVGNAVKFTEEGSVTLTAALVRDAPTPQLRFEVKDTGIGLDEGQLGHLFQPFSQADSSTTRRFGGSGLGLSIVKRLSEMLGGGVSVSSRPGEGSRFQVTIDPGDLAGVELGEGLREADDGISSGSAARQLVGRGLEGRRVLLVEDGVDNQRIISLHLRRAGANVDVLENGRLAVERLLPGGVPTEDYDAVLMDMQMPVMDGYAAARVLREGGYTGVVVALTAHAMAGDRARCLEAGCDDYATKPVEPATLVHKLVSRLEPGTAARDEAKDDTLPPIESSLDMAGPFAEVVQAFVNHLPWQVVALEAALADQDRDTLRRLAHQLHGSGGSYGFAPVSDRAADLERGLIEGAAEDVIRERVRAVVRTCRAVRFVPVDGVGA